MKNKTTINQYGVVVSIAVVSPHKQPQKHSDCCMNLGVGVGEKKLVAASPSPRNAELQLMK